MRQWISFGAAALLSVAVSATPAFAGPINVGIISGGSQTSADAAAQLNDDTFFDFSAVVLNSSQADTLAELSGFDVVVLGGSGVNDDGYTAAMYDAVAAFMAAGGGVVTTGWFDYANNAYTAPSGSHETITPISPNGINYFLTSGQTVTPSGSHPITQGIGPFVVNAADYELGAGIDAGAVVLATGSIGCCSGPQRVAVAYQDLVGRSVYVGGLYLANPGYNLAGLRSGVQDQLFEQAVEWAASTPSAPEPASLLLLGLGTAGYIARSKRTKASRQS